MTRPPAQPSHVPVHIIEVTSSARGEIDRDEFEERRRVLDSQAA